MARKSKPPAFRQSIARTIQALRLKRDVPGSTMAVEGAAVTWIGDLRPSPLSHLYRVRIVHLAGYCPKVWVVNPKLQTREGKRAPHLYPAGNLCLFHPKTDGRWDDSKLIADTLLPWTAEWLLHYEVWLATGVWQGGGHGFEKDREAA